MGKRLANADHRRFFDEFPMARISRFRATGVVDPAKPNALITFPGGQTKLISVYHRWFKRGGGWSLFICAGCGRRAANLWLVSSASLTDAPRCCRCCDAMNIKHRSVYGFGRTERSRARDRVLDRIIHKLETQTPLRLKPAPEAWKGKKRILDNSRRLTIAMRRQMVSLRLQQIASQKAKGAGLKTYEPLAATRQLIEVKPIWRASPERLEQLLDQAQHTIISALKSDDPKQRLAAAKLMMRTKQARERGLA